MTEWDQGEMERDGFKAVALEGSGGGERLFENVHPELGKFIWN